MNQDIKLKGQLKFYMQWPIFLTILLVAMNIWIFKIDKEAGAVMILFVVTYVCVVLFMYFRSRYIVLSDMVDFAEQYGLVQNILLKELPTPYAILLDDGKIIWGNKEFKEMI